jgi:hypothetical protein
MPDQVGTSQVIRFATFEVDRWWRKPKPRAGTAPQSSTWLDKAEQISLAQMGCEARKIPAMGDVFS